MFKKTLISMLNLVMIFTLLLSGVVYAAELTAGKSTVEGQGIIDNLEIRSKEFPHISK